MALTFAPRTATSRHVRAGTHRVGSGRSVVVGETPTEVLETVSVSEGVVVVSTEGSVVVGLGARVVAAAVGGFVNHVTQIGVLSLLGTSLGCW